MASLHGTDGMISECAPSRDASACRSPGPNRTTVVVAPDYTGLGPTGQRHPYISGIPEGRSTIDLVRAVHRLPDVPVRDEWVVYGLSQGGHAAVFTAEIAPTYAPELDLRGAIASRPSATSPTSSPYIDSPQARTGADVPVRAGRGQPRPRPGRVPVGCRDGAAPSVIESSCTNDILTAYREDFRRPDLFDRDPSQDPDARLILEANSPGRVRTPVPVLILHGIEDPIVPTSQSIGVFERQCALGMTVQLSEYQGSNHTMVMLDADDEITTWIEDRFDERPAPSNCPTDGTTGTGPTGSGTAP